MNFVKYRWLFIIFSLIVIGIGVVFYFTKGMNYGIDFTGGTVIEVNTNSFIEEEKIRDIMTEYDNTVSVVYSGENKEKIIIKSTRDFNSAELGTIKHQFEEKLGIDRKSISSDSTGATMGKEIQRKAIISIVIASLLMLVYITIRFEFTFGLSSVIALIHDVLITLAFYAIFSFPVNSSLIAAILTVVGYSINATIIIFDRIRENRRNFSKLSKEEIINTSLKSTMRRSILTTLTTLLAVLTLYYVGVESVKVLALPLIIGMISGTYSSICIAPNLWYLFNSSNKVK